MGVGFRVLMLVFFSLKLVAPFSHYGTHVAPPPERNLSIARSGVVVTCRKRSRVLLFVLPYFLI